jgi:ABC-type oligopeptide transport system substrate-binding subunit
VLDGVAATVYLYGFDLARAPFDDVRARRAVSLAIDRARLAAEVLPGSRVPATGVVPPSVPGAQTRACRDCRHAPDEARALWEELIAERQDAPAPTGDEPTDADPDAEDADPDAADADGPEGAEDPGEGAESGDPAAPEDTGPDATDDGEAEEAAPAARPDELSQIRLTHNRGRTHGAIAARLAADLEAALDVEVTFEALDLGPFVQRVRSGEAALFRLGWEPGQPDAGAYLVPLFHSREVGRENLTGYADEQADALLDEAQALEIPAEARSRYRQAERRILDDLPVLPLLWYRQTRVVAPGVVDLHWPAHGPPDLAAVSLAPPG